MTNRASIDYADVVEQLAERHHQRTLSRVPYANLTDDQQRQVRALVEPILADLLALHGREYEERAICDPAPTVWATVTIRMDRGAQPKELEWFGVTTVECSACKAKTRGSE